MEQSSAIRNSRAKNCAECRRLKIRCDREVPCSNCQRRGVASICPEGTLMSKGHRAILSTTDDLPAKIEELTTRIHELEEALALLQSLHSNEPHPLLASKFSENNEAPVPEFGSLMIDERGSGRFFGSTSSVEWIMLADTAPPAPHQVITSLSSTPAHQEVSPPPESINSTQQNSYNYLEGNPMFTLINSEFPLLVSTELINIDILKEKVVTNLPSREMGKTLMERYYGRGSWEMAPVLRARFVNEFFAPCYDNLDKPSITMHELGFIYAVFATGALHSPEISSNNALAYKYISFSRACLTIDNYFLNTTHTSIDTLLLHVAFHYTWDDSIPKSDFIQTDYPLSAPKPSTPVLSVAPFPISANKAMITLCAAARLAQFIGLHREPTKWGMPPEEVARRRWTMWELVSIDLWTSLVGGRPPLISRKHFDVRLPQEVRDISDPTPSFHLGKHHFSHDCLWDVLDLGLASTTRTSYAALLKVDSKIRLWKLQEQLDMKDLQPSEEQKTVFMFRVTAGMIFREITLMCLHRCYVASALLSPTFDLLKSPYSRSVLAAYASSCTVLSRIRTLYSAEPVAIMKFSWFWTNAFSAGVILGAIVIRAPDCPLATAALTELDLAVEIFTKAQGGYRAKRGLPTLLHLQTSARATMLAFQRGTWSRSQNADSSILRNLGGSGPFVRAHHDDGGDAPAPPPTLATASTIPTLSVVSPSLDEYLRSFDFGAAGSRVGTQDYVPPSDEFLQGIFTGDWNDTLSSNMNDGVAVQVEGRDGITNFGLGRFESPPAPAYFAHTPYSDAGSSSSGVHQDSSIPLSTGPPSFSPQGYTMYNMGEAQTEDLEKALMWDNFLQELGIENHGR